MTFYARYWDPGAENMGYEGVSSAISNTLVIPDSANNDIRVLVPVDSTAEGGRFGFIRLFMQFGETPDEVWLLINPDDPVPNGLSVTFARIGSTNGVNLTGTQWADNDMGQLTTTGTLPGGLSAGVDYYLRTSFTGTFTRQSGNNLLLTGSWSENDVVNLSTTGTLPTGLSTGVDYYLRPRLATLTRVDVNEITLTGTGWADQDQLQLTTTGTLPAGSARARLITCAPAWGPANGGSASPAAVQMSPWPMRAPARTPPRCGRRGSINSASPTAAAA